jgi:hypothetical protein
METLEVALDRQIDHWRKQRIGSQGKSPQEIEDTEKRLDIKLPEDFALYFSKVNGIGSNHLSDTDEGGFSFYQLEDLTVFDAKFKNSPLSSNNCKFILFADYLQKCWSYLIMDFNQLVLKNVLPLFGGSGFEVAEQYKNYFHFRSKIVEAIISYDELDGTSLFEIGKVNEFLYAINDKLLEQLFNSHLKVDQVTMEKFIDNIALFLESSGSSLLSGDESKLREIKLFSEKESEEYTAQLLYEQILAAANKAWEIGNYKEFIHLIDEINKNNLPSSYRLKYKIASEKIQKF